MYMITEAERKVRIPPRNLGEDISEDIDNLTWDTFEGRFNEDKSLTVLIKDVEPVGPGRIVHGDGAVYQTVKYNQLVYRLKDNEVVEG